MSLQNHSLNNEVHLRPFMDSLLLDNIEPIANNKKTHVDEGSVQQMRAQVFNFSKSEDWQSTVHTLKKLLKSDPSAQNYSLLGLAYYKIDELNKAANALEKSIKLDPQDSKTQFFLGLMYFLLDKLAKAIPSFRSSIHLDPKEAKVHFCLGVTYHRLKRWQLAIDSYTESIRLSGKAVHSYLYIYLANAYESLGKEKAVNQEIFFNEAIAVYNQLLKIDPKHISALNGLGELYHSLGHLEEAEKVLEKAIKSTSNNEDTLKILQMVKEDQLAQRLFDLGLLKKINKRITDFTPYQKRKPIKIKGKPLSETVIEDRR